MRLFVQVLSLEARKQLSYRADFWIHAVFGFVAQFGVAYYLWRAIYRESSSSVIGGYSFESMILYYLLVILIGKMVRGADHIADVSQDIYDGGLSRYLVYPTSYFRFKYAQHVGLMVPALVQLVLFVILYVLLLTQPAEARVTPASVLMAAGSVALANLLFYVLHLPIQMVAFWADNVWSLVVMLRFAASLLGGAMLPLALFPGWSQRLLAWLPFRYLFDFPVNTLVGRVSPGEWFAGVAVALLWVLLVSGASLAVWQRGVRSYTGVGI